MRLKNSTWINIFGVGIKEAAGSAGAGCLRRFGIKNGMVAHAVFVIIF